VKHLRTVILVLLTVLLPVRGAVAATMLCAGAAPVHGTVAAVGDAGHDPHAGHGMAAPHTGAHESAHADAPDDAPSGGHASACQFCAGGGCCVTPLAFAPPAVQSPHRVTVAVFPTLTARVTAHYPDGQDRPPRTR
jgi:hypothetical protein